MDRLKHILAGGYWKADKGWVRAGDSVLKVLHTETIIQRHLGWVPSKKVEFGMYSLKPSVSLKCSFCTSS